MPTSLQTRPRWFFLPLRHSSPCETASANRSWLVPAFVFFAAIFMASFLYLHFLTVDRSLWYNPYHDRNAHYLFSLKLATAFREGRVMQLLHDLNEARIWPPLHGLAASSVLLMGGSDYRLAVLPSLTAWVLAVLLAFLVARRAAPRGGTFAGLFAALFLAISPAHRAYAADIMLESLGAALSLLVLYCYLLTVQGHGDDSRNARWLALSLLLLFFEKYNYWLLIVLALLAAEGTTRFRLYRHVVFNWLRAIDWRDWFRLQIRHPLTWIIGLTLLLSLFVYQYGERPLVVYGRSLSLYPPHNVIHVAYVLLFIRLLPWWRRTGRLGVRQLDARLQPIVRWLIYPLSLWFLLPKRPSYFVWYLSLADRAPQQQMDILGGFRDYALWLVQDYHWSPAAALVIAVLCLGALLGWRRLRPGGAAIVALVLLSCILTPTHPNHKSRMLHSWIPAVWVMAGIGAAALVYGRGTARWPQLRPWLAGAALTAAVAMQYPAFLAAGQTLEGGPHPVFPTMLEVTDAYLPQLDGARRTLLLTSLPLKPMAQWTWLERFGHFERLEQRWYGFGTSGIENRRGFAAWLRATDCDTIVSCESTIARPGVDSGPECVLHAELMEDLSHQTVFRLAELRELPHLGCRVRIWKRSLSTTLARSRFNN